MQRVLEMTLEALLGTWRAVAPWLSEAASTVPIWAWTSLATLALVALAVRMLRPRHVAAGAPPDLLMTRVELTATGPASSSYSVDVGFSNLHHEPVQLLRMAIVGRRGRPVVLDVPAIVAARRAVELESATELRPGGRGRLDLYAVVPSSPAKAWRIRVPLTWEPFSQRYSGVLLGQTVRAVRRLPTSNAIEVSAGRPRSAQRSTGDRPVDRAAADPSSGEPAQPRDASPVGERPEPQRKRVPPATENVARPPVAQPPIAGLLAAIEDDRLRAAPSDRAGEPPVDAEAGSDDVTPEADDAVTTQPPRTPRLRFPERF